MSVKAPAEKNFRRAKVRPGGKTRRGGVARWLSWRAGRWGLALVIVSYAGYRATTLLSNGDRLIEKAGLAEKRAQNVATLLRGLGVSSVAVEWKNEAEPGDGQTDPSRRRVTIVVTP